MPLGAAGCKRCGHAVDPRFVSVGRLHLVRKRGQLLAHIQNTRAEYNLPVFGRKLAYRANRGGVVEHFPDSSVQKSIAVDLALIDQYDTLVIWSRPRDRPQAKRTMPTRFIGSARCRASARSSR